MFRLMARACALALAKEACPPPSFDLPDGVLAILPLGSITRNFPPRLAILTGIAIPHRSERSEVDQGLVCAGDHFLDLLRGLSWPHFFFFLPIGTDPLKVLFPPLYRSTRVG